MQRSLVYFNIKFFCKIRGVTDSDVALRIDQAYEQGVEARSWFCDFM